MSDDIKRGGKTALMPADEERALRELGMPIRCCDYWPECSHVLDWYENRRGEQNQDQVQP
jgi:hypothetical protein